MADQTGTSRTSYETAHIIASTLREVAVERARQNAKWGQQDHPNGTGPDFEDVARQARDNCQEAFGAGLGTWRDILCEEVYEAFAESDPAALRDELIQVAAVAAAWIEAIDRTSASTPSAPL